jgi:hypothetical protein
MHRPLSLSEHAMFEQRQISNSFDGAPSSWSNMESSNASDLDIPELNTDASKSHVFPGMANYSLLSVGQLCDEGYIVTF